jgi:hypothetical protein
MRPDRHLAVRLAMHRAGAGGERHDQADRAGGAAGPTADGPAGRLVRRSYALHVLKASVLPR